MDETRVQLSPVGTGSRVELQRRLQPGEPRGTVHTLTELVLDRDLQGARALLLARIEAGESLHRILTGYLAPSARLMGTFWDDDRVKFTEVTAGVGRLQDLQRGLDEVVRSPALGVDAPRVLLATIPGEQHSFGLSVVASLLHHRGWEVTGAPSRSPGDLLAAAGRGWYEVIGLSAGCDQHLEQTAALVARLRDASLNRSVRIVVGGRLVAEQPGLARELGADDELTDPATLDPG